MSARRVDTAKRVIDLVGAVAALLVLAPVLLVIAALIVGTTGRPVLFRQPRVGRFEQPFTIVKFRSMQPPDVRRGLVDDADRLTSVGRMLRRTSLDELPNLWNVVLGHMSLVGPRPLVARDLLGRTPWHARRHEVRPGITGLAQVRGRNTMSRDEQFALDVQYVDRRSVAVDARILVDTAWVVLRREGITSAVDGPAPVFAGTPAAGGQPCDG